MSITFPFRKKFVFPSSKKDLQSWELGYELAWMEITACRSFWEGAWKSMKSVWPCQMSKSKGMFLSGWPTRLIAGLTYVPALMSLCIPDYCCVMWTVVGQPWVQGLNNTLSLQSALWLTVSCEITRNWPKCCTHKTLQRSAGWKRQQPCLLFLMHGAAFLHLWGRYFGREGSDTAEPWFQNTASLAISLWHLVLSKPPWAAWFWLCGMQRD